MRPLAGRSSGCGYDDTSSSSPGGGAMISAPAARIPQHLMCMQTRLSGGVRLMPSAPPPASPPRSGPAARKPAGICHNTAITSTDGCSSPCPGANTTRGCCAVEYTGSDDDQAATLASGGGCGKAGAICGAWVVPNLDPKVGTSAPTPTLAADARGSSGWFEPDGAAPPLRLRTNASAKHKKRLGAVVLLRSLFCVD
jgi:hypothetical protein